MASLVVPQEVLVDLQEVEEVLYQMEEVGVVDLLDLQVVGEEVDHLQYQEEEVVVEVHPCQEVEGEVVDLQGVGVEEVHPLAVSQLPPCSC